MADKFVLIAGERQQLLVNLSQIALVDLEPDTIVLRLAGGNTVQVAGKGAAELREFLRSETVMTNGTPIPADIAI